jgi:hypothetical protein
MLLAQVFHFEFKPSHTVFTDNWGVAVGPVYIELFGVGNPNPKLIKLIGR